MKRYDCVTEKGREELSEGELIELGYKVVKTLLYNHYASFSHYFEDLTQIAIMKVWNALPRYDPDRGKIEPYFYGVARRAIRGEVVKIKSSQSNEEELSDELLAILAKPYSISAERAADFEKRLADFKKSLTRQERRALDMKLDGKSKTAIYNALHPQNKKKRIGKALTPIWNKIIDKYRKWSESSSADEE